MRGLLAVLLGLFALAFAAPAAADPPTAFPFEDTFEDVNPCTGDTMTVTIAGTTFTISTTTASSVTAKGRLRRVMRPLATGRTRLSIPASLPCSG
jgi:hypothetical protein